MAGKASTPQVLALGIRASLHLLSCRSAPARGGFGLRGCEGLRHLQGGPEKGPLHLLSTTPGCVQCGRDTQEADRSDRLVTTGEGRVGDPDSHTLVTPALTHHFPAFPVRG